MKVMPIRISNRIELCRDAICGQMEAMGLYWHRM